MKSIVAINGSPKAKDSVSSLFIKQIEGILESNITVYQATKLSREENIAEALAVIRQADALLIVFPLYVDSLPSRLIKALNLLEEGLSGKGGQLPTVYAICNCGFFEGGHTRIALNIIENFSAHAGLTWGYGIGFGCGGFLQSQSKNMSKGPAANVYAALQELVRAIQTGGRGKKNVFVAPKIPRFFYEFMGNLGWLYMARKNGVGKLQKAKPHLDKSS